MKEEIFFEGDRVRVFDPRLYVNDVDTPLHVTMQPATVVRHYGKVTEYKEVSYSDIPYEDDVVSIHAWKEPSLIDVVFDHDGRTSCGHFTAYVERI